MTSMETARRLREIRERGAAERNDRSRELLAAIGTGVSFVAERDFTAAGVGKAVVPPVGIDGWRDKYGRTVSYKTGEPIDAETVRQLIVAGREVPIVVAAPEPPPDPEPVLPPAASVPTPGPAEPSIWDRLSNVLDSLSEEPPGE